MEQHQAFDKVVAYITHDDRLLVLKHTESEEAGIQVPGGTLRPGENLAEAALREAVEETGLTELQLRTFLGSAEQWLPGPTGRVMKVLAYFHIECTGDVQERWRHFEEDPSDGTPGPIEFELYWVRMPDEVPNLAGELGRKLPELYEMLGLT